MKLSPELEDQYVKEVLHNRSLKKLPGEEWQLIGNFENYSISNYGRVKNMGRWITSCHRRKRKVPELIMNLYL